MPQPISRRFAAWPLLLILLAATASPAAQRYDVEVSVRERIARDVDPAGATLVFLLDLKNLASSRRSLVRYDYRVIFGTTDYVRQETVLDAGIAVPAKGETAIAFPVRVTYETLYAGVPEALGRDRIGCNLVGGMTFQDERRREERVPIAFSGEVPVFRGFQARCLPFQARSLSVGGADLTFRAVWVNPNGFPLRIERVDYEISVAGKILAAGTMAGAGPIEAKGEQPLVVDMLLDFWDIGKDVSAAFESRAVAVRFQGKVEATWEWGRIVLPFDRTEKVEVRSAQNQ